LLDRVRATRLAALGWGGTALSLRSRLAFLHTHLGEPWPDVSEDALLADLGDWLEPLLAGAAGRDDLEAVDVAAALRRRAGRLVGDLERLAPSRVALASGREVALDYSVDPPVLAAKVQDLFGTNAIPALAGGRVPVSVHLLSPAGRPVQVTSDLAGFWTGSWHAVRKEMAGRYPKHAWPEDPTNAEPPMGRRS
jgi:ATP-dependent helicase HrpB